LAGIRKESVRQNEIKLKAGVVLQFDYKDTEPNVFQIRNYGLQDVYFSEKPSVSSTSYLLDIIAGGTRVYTNIKGVKTIFLLSPIDTTIIIVSSEATDLYPNDLDQTQQTNIISQVVASMVGITGALPAGGNNIGKVDINSMPGASIPNIQNVTLTLANTEYPITIPDGTKKFSVTLQDYDGAAIVSVYFTTGAASVIKIIGNMQYYIDGLNTSSLTLYLKSSVAGKIAQIESWK
jgi:hypothetical protein